MRFEEATKKICPYLGKECILEDCMLWVTTVNGKKEIAREIEPYDMTPYDVRNWIRRMKNDGYENIGRQGGFRDYYVKYEEVQEGYCTLVKDTKDNK